jgi:hypothetical protein
MYITQIEKDNLLKHPLVTDVNITDKEITLSIGKHRCSRRSGGSFRMPATTILIRIDNKSPKFRVFLKGTREGLSAYHPNTYYSGGLCLGNIKNDFYKLLSGREYVAAALILIEFLQVST